MEVNEKYKHWQSIIERQKQSGLSELKFCRQENVNHSKFRYYKERISLKNKKIETENRSFA